MRLIAFIVEPAATRHLLDHLGEPSRALRIAPIRDPPWADQRWEAIDVSDSEVDGVEAISAIRRRSPDARFLVLSALRHEQDVFRAVKAGAHGYVCKSAASTELLGAIRLVGSGKRYLPADVVTQALGTAEANSLTSRELQILRRIVAGEDNAAIAAALRIDAGTVKNHVHHILSKLDARSRTHAVAVALQRGLVQAPDA